MRGTLKYLYGLATLVFAAPYVDPQTFSASTLLPSGAPAAVVVEADALAPVADAWEKLKDFDSRRFVSSIAQPYELTERLHIRVPTLAETTDAWTGLARYSQFGPPEVQWSVPGGNTLQNRLFDTTDAAVHGFVGAYRGY